MLHSILSLTADHAGALDEYAINLSTDLSPLLTKHFRRTQTSFKDADRASSLLQAQWMMQRAKDMRATHVLDVGCYTGLSALAWYEGTKETNASIFTIEYDAKLAAFARDAFHTYGCDERIRVIEASAEDALERMSKPFDIVFVDLEFFAYRHIVETILDMKLLAKKGVILVDNVFARGFVVGEGTANIDVNKIDHWTQSGKLVAEFNAFVATDSRVSVTLWPFFDGIAEIRLKDNFETE